MSREMKLKVSRFELAASHWLIALGERAKKPGSALVRLGEKAEAAAERRARKRGVSADELVAPLLERGYWRPI